MDGLVNWLWNDALRSSEFWSAITGAIVGGLIAFRIQIVALNAAAKQRAEDALEKKRAVAHALLFKLIRIYSNLSEFHSHIEEAFSKAGEAKSKASPWQIVTPILNGPSLVHFSSDEMALVLSFKGSGAFDAIASIDEVHNSTVEIFNAYRQMRVALLSSLPADANSGMVFSAMLTEAQVRALAPKMAELDDLLVGLRDRCKRDLDDSWDALNKVHGQFVESLGFTYQLQKKVAK